MAEGELKYALIAHEKGTDNYVVAAVGGTLVACGQGLVDVFRAEERLVAFDDVVKAVLAEQRMLEQERIIPPGSTEKRFVREMTDLLGRSVMYLGYPPKENVEFFSLPQIIVDNLNWVPRGRRE